MNGATTTFTGATAKQIAFFNSLAAKRPLWASRQADIATCTKAQASKLIDAAMKAPVENVPQAKAAYTKPAAPVVTITKAGMYRLGVDFYLVKKAKTSGKLYAQCVKVMDEWNDETNKLEFKADFEYAPGIVAKLTPENKLTQAEAKEFGMNFGICVCCGAKLTDKSGRSQAAGYGMTCASNNGWWYPTAAEAAKMQLAEAAW